MEFLIKNWKDILIAFLLSGLAFIIFDWSKQSAQIKSLEGSLDDTKTELEALKTEVEAYRRGEAELKKQLADAQSKAAEVRIVYRDKIQVVREEVIPKECKAAIDFASKNTEVFKWSK